MSQQMLLPMTPETQAGPLVVTGVTGVTGKLRVIVFQCCRRCSEPTMGCLLYISNEIEKPATEVPKLFQHIEQRGIKPTSFISAKYSRDFLTDFLARHCFNGSHRALMNRIALY